MLEPEDIEPVLFLDGNTTTSSFITEEKI